MDLLLMLLTISGFFLSFASSTEKPVIGVVVHEIISERTQALSPNSTAYLAASYVKAIEAAGARVLVILLGKDYEYYRTTLNHVNGLLFTGGDAKFDSPNGYAAATKILYKEATKLNQHNDVMPILAICLGFEYLMQISNNGKECLIDCNSSNVALPLQFKPDFQDSNLFRDADPYILQILSTQPVTSNHHQYCMTETNLTKYYLDKEWKVLSTNNDKNGIEFISTIESRYYPYVGLQFHPEKNAFEWKDTQNNPHSSEAIYSARYFFDWLIKEARKSKHSFDTKEDEFNLLVDNFPRVFTAPLNMTFDEIYLF